MNGPSLGLRSGSYGSSLDKYGQNGASPVQPSSITRNKSSKMVKEKERLFPSIFKFVGRKNFGMLLLCSVSAAVFLWVLYVGKGEDSEESLRLRSLQMNRRVYVNLTETSPSIINQVSNMNNQTFLMDTLVSYLIDVSPPPPPPPPPPPSYFLGYSLPPGHPCESFTLPPPPADRKRTGPRPCPVCYLPVQEAVALMPKFPSFSPVLKELTYIYEESLNRETEFGGSEFGGYPTLKQRTDSFDIRESMNVHCGFVKGQKPGLGTGFDIDEPDLLEMEQCRGVVVASAVFGAFDEIQHPKNISEYSKDTVCFYMFVDEQTNDFLRTKLGVESVKKVGIWRVVVLRNLPYADGRRNGKIPKLLMHRIFPSARYSLWIDGKLELVVDPYQILERFLWRKNATFAISKHYKRFDVFTEAEANKAAGKYDNHSIDFQVDFYKKEGLTPYSTAKLPITSDVPEGCVIIREHVPISNLFSCLWFNEVDRFTSRDQISFSTVRDKITAKTNWTPNMFLDCERRNFVIQRYHLADLEIIARRPHRHIAVDPPPPPLSITTESPMKVTLESPIEKIISPLARKLPQKRGREKRSRRHRKIVASGTG